MATIDAFTLTYAQSFSLNWDQAYAMVYNPVTELMVWQFVAVDAFVPGKFEGTGFNPGAVAASAFAPTAVAIEGHTPGALSASAFSPGKTMG